MPLRLLPLVALLTLATPLPAAADAPAAGDGSAEVAVPAEGWIWDALPMAQLSRDFFAEMSSPDLFRLVRGASLHLTISEQIPELDQVDDLALLFRAATAVQMLEARGVLGADPDLRVAARTFAWFCYQLGHRYETDPTIRQNLDRLPAIVNPESRPVAEALVGSIRGVRAYARRWFPRAFAAEVGDRDPSPAALSQLGAFLRDDGELRGAWEAFAKAISLEPRAHILLHGYEVLLKVNTEETDKTAAELREAAVASNPILSTRFERAGERLLQRRQTAAWRADPKPLELAEAMALVDSLTAEGAVDEAEAVVKEALARHKDEPEAWAFAGSFHSHQRHSETLRTLFIDAAAAGMMSDRMRELRLVALSEARLAEMVGAPAPLADSALLEKEAAWLAGRGPDQAFVVEASELIAVLTRFVVAERGGADAAALEAEKKEARKVVAGLTKRFGDRADAWRLALGAYSGLAELRTQAAGLRRGVQRVRGVEGVRLRAELERLLAGRALSRRELPLIQRALKELAGLEGLREREAKRLGAPFPITAEERAVERLLFVQLAAMQADLSGAWRGAGDLGSFEAAFEALGAIRDDFDKGTEIGRKRAQSNLVTMAALAERLGRAEEAEVLWREVRFNRADAHLGHTATANLMLMGGFGDGAIDFATRALDAADSDDARHHSLLMRANVKQAVGAIDGDEGARADFRRALALWDETNMPDSYETGALRPVSLSSLNFSVQVSHTYPVRLEVIVEPIIALLAEPAASRSAIEAMLGGEEKD